MVNYWADKYGWNNTPNHLNPCGDWQWKDIDDEVNISGDTLDQWIQDLQTEVDTKSTSTKNIVTYDTSSKEKGRLENHVEDAYNRKIKDLTIKEFKLVIREVVREELSHINFSPNYIPPVPPQPYYGRPDDPWWMQHVYCKEDNNI